MSIRSCLAIVGVILAACGDTTGPDRTAGIQTVPVGAMGAARAAKRTAGPALTPLAFASWAPPLETYDTTFVVTQGKASADTIYFRKRPEDLLRVPYMVLAVPATAQFVDASGYPLPRGTKVNLTVQADTRYVLLNFGPHGSTFSKTPATLKVFWLYTDLLGRWGGDLKMWYQPDANTAWSSLATQVDLEFCWLTSDLTHFSNYAVAY